MKLTALQPNLFPSKTYFDLIGQVDKVVFIDDSFYNEKTWVNKVALKKQGKKFIFRIDLGKFPSNSNLCDINLDCNKWRKKFLKVISLNYKNCKTYFFTLHTVIDELSVQRVFQEIWRGILEMFVKSLRVVFGEYFGGVWEVFDWYLKGVRR